MMMAMTMNDGGDDDGNESQTIGIQIVPHISIRIRLLFLTRTLNNQCACAQYKCEGDDGDDGQGSILMNPLCLRFCRFLFVVVFWIVGLIVFDMWRRYI